MAISEAASAPEDKAKLVFERKRGGERRVRCVVQAGKGMFQKEIDFEQSYPATAPWNFINEEVKAGLIRVVRVSSEDNSADFLTKFNARPKFKKDARKLMGPQPGLD